MKSSQHSNKEAPSIASISSDVSYVCPACKSDLKDVSDGITRCDVCAITYPAVEGVPLFAVNRYWGKIPEHEMKEAIATIDQDGWEEFQKKYQKRLDVAFDDSRADWRFEVPLPDNSVILDMGAGLGRNTIPLARIAKQVVAFDQSLERARFIRRRVQKEGLTNTRVFVGDVFQLPFAPKSFDLIVMNGVLEWVGKTDRFSNPRDAQRAALSICRELLRDGGHLYIGIENRYSFVYLRGTPEHGGLRYTTFLPRRIASLYTRIRQGEPYRTYTHTRAGYQKLLHEAGFTQPTFFLPYPGYNLPRIVVPYHDLRAFRYMLTKLLSSRRLGPLGIGIRFIFSHSTVALRIYRYFFFSFNIIAKR